jgi:HSP20 family protein
VSRPDDLDRLQEEIQDLFTELWHVPRFAGRRTYFRPRVDSYRTADPPALTVLVELPGVEPESIEVVVTGSRLVVRGDRRRPRVAGQVYEQVELDYGAFERQLLLRQPVDTVEARATLERGLLTVVLPIATKEPATGRILIAVGRAS